MSDDELRLVYRVGVEMGKGKVQVNGNPPEQPTVRETLHHIKLAIEGGVEIVNIYGPAGWHFTGRRTKSSVVSSMNC